MSIDTVNDLPRRIRYTAGASQTAFDYPWPIFTDADLKVYVNGVLKALNTDYTVAGETDDAGGTLTFTTARTAGEIVVIYSELAIERTTDYQQNGPLSSSAFNDELDRLTLVAQEQRDQIGRAIRFPMTAAVTDAQSELDPATYASKYLSFDANGVPTPATLVSGTLTQAVIAALYDPATTAETTAGVVPNTVRPSLPYDLRRAGLVPNSTGARAANTAALKTLLDPDVVGPKGWFIFANSTGADTYYFNMDDVPIRDGCVIDGQDCVIDVAGSYSASNDTHGFFEMIRDVTIENMSINFDYDGSAGINNGNCIRIGLRNGYAFGAGGLIDEEGMAVPMGNCVVRNVRMVYDNPDTAAPILLLGGLNGVLIEQFYLNGSGTATKGIYYEFGHYHYEATAANITTSHAINLHLRDIHIKNLNTGVAPAVSVVGAMSCFVQGLWVEDAFNVFVGRPGEALYYNKGAPYVDMRAHYDLRQIHGKDIASTAIAMQGSESAAGGYLAAVIAALAADPEAIAQTDLITFNLDGFYVDAAVGVLASSRCSIANGSIRNFGASGGLLLQDECIFFDIDNVEIRDGGGIGVRCQTGTNIWTTARFKAGTMRNCFVAGSTGAGSSWAQSDGVVIDSCRFGYELVHDGLSESTQTAGVSNGSTSFRLTVRNCYGGGLASGSMYTNASGGGWKYAKVESPAGIKTLSNAWTIDGHGFDSDIGDAATTLDPGVDLPEQRYATTLTANRIVTLGTGYQGARFRVVRTGLGAFTLDVGGLKTIPSATAAAVEVEHDGTAWRLTDYSPL